MILELTTQSISMALHEEGEHIVKAGLDIGSSWDVVIV